MKEQAHQSVSQPPENSDGRIIPQFMRLGALSCCSRSLRGESRICGEWWFRHRVHELNFGPLCVRCMHPVVGLLFWQNGPCHYGHLDRATPWLQKKRWQGSFDDWTGLVSPAVAGQHTDSCWRKRRKQRKANTLMLKKAKKAKTGQHTHAEEGEESSSEGALARAGPQAWLLHLKDLNCTNVEHGDNENTSTLHGHCSRNRQGQWYYILYYYMWIFSYYIIMLWYYYITIIFIIKLLSPSIIINHHQSSSIIINHHQSLSIIINHH